MRGTTSALSTTVLGAMDVEVGQVLNGKYRIVRRIGAGGMATVYEALHTGLGTALAVKVLLPELARVLAQGVGGRFTIEDLGRTALEDPRKPRA